MPRPDDPTVAQADALPPRSSAVSPSGWLTTSDAINHGRFSPGTVIRDRYRIVGLLGKGGMGEVYRADDLKLGQSVALKFLPEALANDAMRLAQFHGEVRLARQISHPNVCRVYDIDEIDGHPFLSMEYVDGENLASLLRQVGRFPEDKALSIARQFCAGVAAAHDCGVLHRDLKPANVMIDARGNARVLDFGLAVAAGSAIHVHGGTPGYMAPEQLAGRDVSVRSDIYAIGLVVYELFTGRRAFEAQNLPDLLRLHDENAVTPPTSIVPSLDPAIERAILRCLAPEPERRPASAIAVSAALPGGDPLAALLAAGETPSPAMVAAAGAEEALAGRLALGAIAAVVIVLVLLPFIKDRALLLRAIPPLKATDVLVDRARTIRQTLGYSASPRDEFFRFAIDFDYLNYIERTDPSPRRWERLRAEHAAPITFWYRSSPRDLIPLAPSASPSPGDPPLTVSGMTFIELDPQGRLIEFNAVPPQRDAVADAAPAPDWSALFAAAGLRLESFAPAAPEWTPRTFADARAAWEGALPGDPDTKVRIEAATYRGHPVFFQRVGPWSRAARMELPPRSSADAALTVVSQVVVSMLLVGAAFAARRQLRRGRGDRRGADRVALAVMGVFAVSWLVGGHHVANLNTEVANFLFMIAGGLLIGGILWLFYLALEPLVRRWNPRALVGWTRLINGSLRDPQVGRDLLAGLVAGVLYALIRAPRGLTATLAGAAAPAPLTSSLAPLMGIRDTLMAVLAVLPNAVTESMILILIFALLRIVFRTVVASAVIAGLMVALVAIGLFTQPGGWTQVPLVVVGMTLVFTVIVRFGLLAAVVMFFVGRALDTIPLTADPSEPYFAASLWTLAGVLALTLFAAQAARAGQPVVKFLPD